MANNIEQNGTSSDGNIETPITYITNIYDNSGAIAIGPNNVVIVQTPATSSTTGPQREISVAFSSERTAVGDLKTCSVSCPTRSWKKNGDSPSRERLANDDKLTEISKVFPVVKKRRCCLGVEKNGRKRMKRQQRNSRSSSPSSGDDVLKTAKVNKLCIKSDISSLEQALKLFRYCIKPLHPLRDNGLWSEFDRAAEELLVKAEGDLACKIIIFLEKSLALSLQRKLDEAENLLNVSAKKIRHINGSIRLLLEVLSNCYFAQLNRRKKMLGRTQECLKISKKLLSGFPPCLVVAIVLYEEGSYKRDIAAMTHVSRKKLAIAEAKEVMKRCVDLCCRLDRDQVYVRKQHIIVSKMAIMNLHCETSESRLSKNITSRNIEEASNLIEILHTDYYLQKEVQGGKIQRLIAKVDLFYRLDKFPEAEKVAQEALEIAERLEFNLDVMPLVERLTDIRKIAESSSNEAFREIPKIIDSCSGSSKNNSPCSSDYEDKS